MANKVVLSTDEWLILENYGKDSQNTDHPMAGQQLCERSGNSKKIKLWKKCHTSGLNGG